MANIVCQIFIFLLLCLSASSDGRIKILRDYSYFVADSFTVYWNVPTHVCKKHGYDFGVATARYGIVSNLNDSFRGTEVNILYDPGQFPAIMKAKNGQEIERNGGIPQQGNLTVHLNAFKKVVEETVSTDLNGIGIIDFETWRPNFRQNWVDQAIYKELSKAVERQRHLKWTEKEVEARAKRNFETAARKFMKKTLEMAKKMRPNAKWGYYGFPYCYNFHAGYLKPQCVELAMKENDEILWLFNTSTALYPSLYMASTLTEIQKAEFVIGRLNEAWRLVHKVTRSPEVYPYVWFKYNDNDEFLSWMDMYTTLELTRKYKLGGAIIWGASKNVNSSEKCKELYDYLNETLGPIVLRVQRNQKNVDFITKVSKYFTDVGCVFKYIFVKKLACNGEPMEVGSERRHYTQPVRRCRPRAKMSLRTRLDFQF